MTESLYLDRFCSGNYNCCRLGAILYTDRVRTDLNLYDPQLRLYFVILAIARVARRGGLRTVWGDHLGTAD